MALHAIWWTVNFSSRKSFHFSLSLCSTKYIVHQICFQHFNCHPNRRVYQKNLSIKPNPIHTCQSSAHKQTSEQEKKNEILITNKPCNFSINFFASKQRQTQTKQYHIILQCNIHFPAAHVIPCAAPTRPAHHNNYHAYENRTVFIDNILYDKRTPPKYFVIENTFLGEICRVYN